MCASMTENVEVSDKVHSIDTVENLTDTIEERVTRDKNIGDGVEYLDGHDDELERLEDDGLLTEDQGDDDPFRDDDGIGDEAYDFSDDVQPFRQDIGGLATSTLIHRVKASQCEEVVEEPKAKVIRRVEEEKTVSLRIAAGILALSVLIYSAFVIYTEPLRQAIVNMVRDTYSNLMTSTRLLELSTSEDTEQVSLPTNIHS